MKNKKEKYEIKEWSLEDARADYKRNKAKYTMRNCKNCKFMVVRTVGEGHTDTNCKVKEMFILNMYSAIFCQYFTRK